MLAEKQLKEITVAGGLDTSFDYVVVTHDNGDTTFTDYLVPASNFATPTPAPGTPTVVLGAGAGTGATYTLINATDRSGVIEIVTSGTPTTSSTIATFTFGTPYATEVNICFSAANGEAATPGLIVYAAMENTHKLGFIIGSNSVGTLNTARTYRWSYVIL